MPFMIHSSSASHYLKSMGNIGKLFPSSSLSQLSVSENSLPLQNKRAPSSILFSEPKQSVPQTTPPNVSEYSANSTVPSLRPTPDVCFDFHNHKCVCSPFYTHAKISDPDFELITRLHVDNPGKAQSPIDLSSQTLPKKRPDWNLDIPNFKQRTTRLIEECDIRTFDKNVDSVSGIEFDYKKTPFHLEDTTYTIQGTVKDYSSSIYLTPNNHDKTLQIKQDTGNPDKLNPDSLEFHLMQFHFHWPAEHRCEKTRDNPYDIELHFVHHCPQLNSLAVVGIFLDTLTPVSEKGSPLDTLWKQFETAPEDSTLDPGIFLPQDSKMWQYSGSLTAPPYSESILWFLFKEPVGITQENLDFFKNVQGNLQNARPLQPLNDRTILHMEDGRLGL